MSTKNRDTAERLGASPDPEAFRQELAKALNEAGHVVVTRASQPAQGANTTPDTTPDTTQAAHGVQESAEAISATRDQIRDILHSHTYGCENYHAVDCDPCTELAAAVIPVVRTQVADEILDLIPDEDDPDDGNCRNRDNACAGCENLHMAAEVARGDQS